VTAAPGDRPAPADHIMPVAMCDLPCAGTQSNATERLREGLSGNESNMNTVQCKAMEASPPG